VCDRLTLILRYLDTDIVHARTFRSRFSTPVNHPTIQYAPGVPHITLCLRTYLAHYVRNSPRILSRSLSTSFSNLHHIFRTLLATDHIGRYIPSLHTSRAVRNNDFSLKTNRTVKSIYDVGATRTFNLIYTSSSYTSGHILHLCLTFNENNMFLSVKRKKIDYFQFLVLRSSLYTCSRVHYDGILFVCVYIQSMRYRVFSKNSLSPVCILAVTKVFRNCYRVTSVSGKNVNDIADGERRFRVG